MDRSDCQIWPLSKITDLVGFLGYHWTNSRNLPGIRRNGLGYPVEDWTVQEHESWYLYCLLSAKRQAILDEAYFRPRAPEGRRTVDGTRGIDWHRDVHWMFQAQHPDAFMTWVAEDEFKSQEYGDALIEVRLDDVSRMRGNIFPDVAFGWAIITYGKRIPKKSLYVFTKQDLKAEGLI
jgi:hypothetical protein